VKKSKKSARLGMVAGLVVILGGFTYLLYGGIGENLVYFVTPTELYERGEGAWDTPVRLGGQVVPGSVQWNPEALDLRFVVSDGEHELAVRSRGAPPQMFRDGIGVVVEGRLEKGGATFESTNLMVKHSNEYRAPDDGAHPKELYQTLMKD
jgi:cytochrome c-type biogenesis protein CcmE